MRDLFHDLAPIVALATVSLGATGSGGKTTKIIKRDGAQRVLFVNNFGTITATGATVVVGMKHGDATGSMTNVASGDVNGGLAAVTAAGIGATSARASGVSKNCIRTVEYVGLKEFVELTLAPTASGGILAGSTALLGMLRTLPGVAQGQPQPAA